MKSARLVLLALLAAGWAAHSYLGHRTPRPADGVLVATAPAWGGLPNEGHVAYQSFGSNQVIAQASLDITGRILAVKQYPAEGFGERVRTDLAFGWGRMSDNRVLDHLDIRQESRGMEIVPDQATLIQPAESYGSAINLSVYSDYDAATAALDSIVAGDVVRMVGWRMRIRNAQGQTWDGGSGHERTGQNYGIILVLKLQINGQKKFGNWDAAPGT